MAYIKERGNNNYFVRVSYGMLDNGRPFQKSRLFHPSKVNLPESKLRKELDAFVKALEEECRIEFELKHQHKPNVDFDENKAAQELAEEAGVQESQHVLTPIQTPSTPLFSDFCEIYLTAKKENISSTTFLLYETAIQRILIPKLGHLHLDEIKPFHVQELINFLATPSGRVDKKGEKLAPAIQLGNLFDALSVREFGIIMDRAVDFFFYKFIVFHLCNSFRLLFLCLLRCSFGLLSKRGITDI